jgi:SAM-dependent methyltransferase
VKDSTVQLLLDLNRQFYQTFALQFSATRGRLQPGVQRILADLPEEIRILDLGCGNGELARQLVRSGRRGRYVGLDFSPELLAIASGKCRAAGGNQSLNCSFLQDDLSSSGWDAVLRSPPLSLVPSTSPPAFDLILAFAVLHHLPGAATRRSLLRTARSWLVPGASLIHSEWQFQNSPRLLARVLPWETAGLNTSDLDPGDYLLDWRQGDRGLRYVHLFSEAELNELAVKTGFKVKETFLSDGEGGRLGLYQIWEAV